MDKIRGGDGDALDIIIIAEYLDKKTIIEVKAIGMLKLKDGGEIDNKIIAVPVDEELNIINVDSFIELENNYPEILNILKTWFTSYKGAEEMKFIGWENDKEAMKEVAKWATE